MRGEADIGPAGRLRRDAHDVAPVAPTFDQQAHADLRRTSIDVPRDQVAQMAVAQLGITVAGRNARILLGFDDQPALVAVPAQQVEQGREVDRAVAGHGEGAVDHRLEKAPVAIPRHRDHLRPHVLAVHVADAPDVLREHRDRIAAGEGHVAAVEQQADLVADQRHQAVDIGRRLDVRAHVVVIGEPHAVRERVPRERGDAVGVLAPRDVRDEARTLVQRLRRALDAVGDFAVDHHLRAVVREQLEMRRDCGDLLVHRAAREPARVPAGHELESVRRQHRGQRLGFARKLVAELEALVADRLAFGERDLERRLAAERGQVVVAPRDRIDADLHLERFGHGRCCFLAFSYASRARRTLSRSDTSGTATSHHQPPSSVVRSGSVSMQIT